MEEPTIGGLPAERFVNRMVRSRSQSNKQHYMPCLVKKIVGRKVSLIPKGHRNEVLVDTADIKPWWSRNKDLERESLILEGKLPPDTEPLQPETIVETVTPIPNGRRERHRVPCRVPQTPESFVIRNTTAATAATAANNGSNGTQGTNGSTPATPAPEPTSPETPVTPITGETLPKSAEQSTTTETPVSVPSIANPQAESKSESAPEQLPPPPAEIHLPAEIATPTATEELEDKNALLQIIDGFSGYQSKLGPRETLLWFEDYAIKVLEVRKAQKLADIANARLAAAQEASAIRLAELEKAGITFGETHKATTASASAKPAAGKAANPPRKRGIPKTTLERFSLWQKTPEAIERFKRIEESKTVAFGFTEICKELNIRTEAGETFAIMMESIGYTCELTRNGNSKRGYESVTIRKS
jgi:hypothetical protein